MSSWRAMALLGVLPEGGRGQTAFALRPPSTRWSQAASPEGWQRPLRDHGSALCGRLGTEWSPVCKSERARTLGSHIASCLLQLEVPTPSPASCFSLGRWTSSVAAGTAFSEPWVLSSDPC